ncbi:dihydrodipicolinate synthetase [Sulfolobus islandicus Y.G.57.14]|uniref:Dihydrodipicolinate synthase/N-acetylneuraminatelyase n=5 Tax=Saccharolobus islandicus TaxID=43080 RepID=M9U3H7_SACIS|nr:dihydrodipicolinate synthase family protein [Sulfolobus islandicus]ACP34238.1 dihydrodipicolinate synthetase [Sulfolobus islandicus L.S.2.15]ACP44380.1 dihydrodipicolinate synthetase [Sulfolobus islandicus Y.G.57.14]ACP47282.1 dihydrodipicolinate synthetase [Sulfolobus islandicus Y.N.15.51]ADB85887.1 dihydrodipicolinate synthetase [Sulfolobus islandicus L.D.8.5]AGJ61564.1 Dihydrodipicolinate synthase/N-acetylneuraminatelyase [Sulfolobus islandicus LAL14/1]
MKDNISALITPFDDKENINVEALQQLLDFLTRSGIKDFWVLGTSGEFNMLSQDERILIVSKIREITKGKIYAGINENSLKNSLILAKKYYDIGVDYIFSVPPIYHKPSEKGLVTYFNELRNTIDLPLFLYNIPSFAGYNVPLRIVEKLAEEEVLNGMKYSTTDFVSFLKYLKGLKGVNKNFKVFIGEDRMILSALIYDADGAVSGISNLVPELVTNLFLEFDRGNIQKAIEIQRMVNKLVDVVSLGDYPSGIKIGLRYRGINVGSVRKPLMEDSRAEGEIYNALKEIGI